MIKSFGHRETKKVWQGEFSSKLPNVIQHEARKKLRMLNNAQNINDLRIPPSNRLEKLRSSLKGFHSIRINKRWKIVFQWISNNAAKVNIEDYQD